MTTARDAEPGPGAVNRPVVALAAAVLLAGVALGGYAWSAGGARFAVTGIGYPGVFTDFADVVGHFAAATAAALCLGLLCYVVVTAVPDEHGRIDPGSFRVHLWIERLSIGWTVLAAALAVIESASSAGVSAARLIGSGLLGDALGASEQARGWLAAAVFAGVVAVGIRFTVRWLGHCLLLVPASIGVVAVPVTGNAGQGPGHDLATSSVIVFAVALAVVFGIRVGAVLSPPATARIGDRIRTLSALASTAAVLYGAVLLTLMITGTSVFDSGYGRLGLVAGAALTGVWVADLAALLRPGPRKPWRDTAGAVAAITALAAVSAMAVTPPPRFLIHEFSAWDVFLGYQLPGPASVVNLLTYWRFDSFLGCAAVALGVLYLVAVIRLRRRGDDWPLGRTVAWVIGCLALLITTSAGPRAYGSAMFSVHMGEHMALNMFVPVLLVLGAPVTLALRVFPAAGTGEPPGPREWITWLVHSRVTAFLAHPVTAFVLFVGSLYLVYFTPLFDTLVRYHWGHELMSVHFLIVGYLFYWGIIGVDPGPRRLPFLGRLGLLFAVMPFHAFFGIATMTMTALIGGDFYPNLDLPWMVSLASDQRVGGAIAWGTSELPVIIVVVALVAQWARQDRRAGARQDRHADRGYDDDLDAYNEMLRELSRTRK